MPVATHPHDAKSGKKLHVDFPYEVYEGLKSGVAIPVTLNPYQSHGTFKAASRTTAGTSVITEAKGNGSIILTDLLISTDKTQATSVTVQFSDGVDTIVIFVVDSTNAPANVSTSFAGRWQGWSGANVEMVTVGAVTATVAAGYVHVGTGLDFTEWDAAR